MLSLCLSQTLQSMLLLGTQEWRGVWRGGETTSLPTSSPARPLKTMVPGLSVVQSPQPQKILEWAERSPPSAPPYAEEKTKCMKGDLSQRVVPPPTGLRVGLSMGPKFWGAGTGHTHALELPSGLLHSLFCVQLFFPSPLNLKRQGGRVEGQSKEQQQREFFSFSETPSSPSTHHSLAINTLGNKHPHKTPPRWKE